jgi:hypothetical protein
MAKQTRKRSALKSIIKKGNGDAVGPRKKKSPSTGRRPSKVANIA